jgi:hypothetical protein
VVVCTTGEASAAVGDGIRHIQGEQQLVYTDLQGQVELETAAEPCCSNMICGA